MAFHPDHICTLVAEVQHGVLTDIQARLAGITEEGIRWRIGQNRWVRILPGVLLVAGSPKTWKQEASAAASWGGDGSAISHGASLRIRGYDGFKWAPIDLSITRRKDGRTVPFKVHRVDHRLLHEIQVVDGIPCTSIPRTVVDLFARKHPRAERVLNEGLRRKDVTPESFFLFLEQEFMCGRRGMAGARLLAQKLTGTESLTQSDLEQKLAAYIWASDLPKPELQFPLALPERTIFFDFAYQEEMLAIEVDGFETHGGRGGFDGDRERDIEAGLLDWKVLRFTWGQVMFRRDWVLASIRKNLELRRGWAERVRSSA